MLRAYDHVAASRSECGTTWVTRFICFASVAGINRPLSKRSLTPVSLTRGLNSTETSAGTNPILTSVKPNFARSEAILASHARTSPAPPAIACPLMRPRTNFVQDRIARKRLPRACESARLSSGEASPKAESSWRSAPAENTSPAPVKIRTRTNGSWDNDSMTLVSSTTND